jgi:hypothetical protein
MTFVELDSIVSSALELIKIPIECKRDYEIALQTYVIHANQLYSRYPTSSISPTPQEVLELAIHKANATLIVQMRQSSFWIRLFEQKLISHLGVTPAECIHPNKLKTFEYQEAITALLSIYTHLFSRRDMTTIIKNSLIYADESSLRYARKTAVWLEQFKTTLQSQFSYIFPLSDSLTQKSVCNSTISDLPLERTDSLIPEDNLNEATLFKAMDDLNFEIQAASTRTSRRGFVFFKEDLSRSLPTVYSSLNPLG